MIEERFQQCRAYGHRWDSVNVTFTPTVWIERLVCIDCDTERQDYIKKRTFETYVRRYKYPRGYQTKGGVKQDDVRAARRQVIERKYQ